MSKTWSFNNSVGLRSSSGKSCTSGVMIRRIQWTCRASSKPAIQSRYQRMCSSPVKLKIHFTPRNVLLLPTWALESCLTYSALGKTSMIFARCSHHFLAIPLPPLSIGTPTCGMENSFLTVAIQTRSSVVRSCRQTSQLPTKW